MLPKLGSMFFITFHAIFTGFISAGLAVVENVSSHSGVIVIPFLANTSYTPAMKSVKLYGLVVCLSTWYSDPFSSSDASYSSSLLRSSFPASSIGISRIFWLSNGAPCSFSIASILSRYSFMNGFCLILSLTSGVSPVA